MKSWRFWEGNWVTTEVLPRLKSLLFANWLKRSEKKKLLGMKVFQSGDHLICKLHECLHRELALAAAKEILQ